MSDWVEDEEGNKHSLLPGLEMVVLNDGENKLFYRNFIKLKIGAGVSSQTRWVVGELNGVRAYYNGSDLILTTRDLRE